MSQQTLDRTERARWAAEITACWRRSVDAIIETGRLISAAKAALPHGEFLPMVRRDLPFGPRTAAKLMAIAKDERLLSESLRARLPASWATVYEITRLDDDSLRDAADKGLIRPETERSEVMNLLRRSAVDRPQVRPTPEFSLSDGRIVTRIAVGELRSLAQSLRERAVALLAEAIWLQALDQHAVPVSTAAAVGEAVPERVLADTRAAARVAARAKVYE